MFSEPSAPDKTDRMLTTLKLLQENVQEPDSVHIRTIPEDLGNCVFV